MNIFGLKLLKQQGYTQRDNELVMGYTRATMTITLMR
jgi:hypothetical protein